MNLKKFPVVAILVLELINISIHAFAEQDNSASGDNQNTETAATQDYYDKLASECNNKESENCCLASVKAMKAGNYTLVPEQGCLAGYQPNMMKCKDSYTWCEPIENTSQETAGQNTNPSPRQPATATKSNPATSTGRQSLNDKTILPVGFPLKSGHKLYMEYDASIVPMGKLFDLEVSSGNLTQVKTVDELSKLTGQINAKEQALAFVKFFTSEPTRHLLKPNPFSGIEPSDSYVKMTGSLTRLLTSAKVDRIDGQWVIERDLLLYPNWTSQKLQTPAQLVRSLETLSQAGTYTFNIKQVLAEGDGVNALLPYYK